jgi:putative FmdB family regulatory protein
MPLYDYECRNCGNRVEVLHGVNDSGPASCEVCGGQMRKLLNPPAIVFKGSGWAKKDARDAKPAAKSSSKPATDGDGSKASDSGSSSETSTGTKSTDSSADRSASKGTSTASASD